MRAVEPNRQFVSCPFSNLVLAGVRSIDSAPTGSPQIEGLAQNQDKVLHAWKAGPQTVQLAQQLAAMPDGGMR